MNQFKKSMGLFGVFVSIMLLCVIGITVYVDPFFQYHSPLKNFPYLVDNQLNQNPGMAKNLEYDSVILGSSMTVNFNTNWFEELMGLQTIKLSYSGAYPKDQSNIMKIIFESDNQVEKVFLGIDSITYTGGIDETKYPIPEYLYDYNYFNDFEYVLNKDVLLNYILRPIADPEKSDLATIYFSWWTEEYYNKQWVMHNYRSPEATEEETDSEAYIPMVEANLTANICPFIEENPETEFVVFFPPYSILYWNDVLQENHLEATMREFEYITERLLSYENVSVYFFLNQEEIVCNLDNYADYSHYHPDFNRYMTECFAKEKCRVLSAEQVEGGQEGQTIAEHLQQMRDIIENYDFEELFSVEY